MPARTAGRVAMVTGGGGEIGGAVARALATNGAAVVLCDLPPRVHEALSEFPSAGAAHSAQEVDITDERQVARAVAAIADRYGRLDILVNCAGIVLRPGGVKPATTDLDLASWRRSLDVNLTGVFLCARAVIPHMEAGGWGRIVTISSQGGRTGGVFSSVDYAAAKSGVIGFSRTLAVEVGVKGITVNCVAPGRVATDMTGYASEQEQNKAFLASLPIPRMADKAEVAATVAFLCSNEAGYITGATIDVNGGGFMA